MKIVIITDTHIGIKNDSPVMVDYLERSFDWFFQEIDDRNIRHVVHMGDLYDRRKYVNYVTAMKCRTQFLEQLQRRDIETHIIAGNHDVFYRNTNKINALDELVTNRYSNIKTYIDRPATITIDGLNILLVPWIDDSKPQSSYDAIKNSTSEIVMGHLAISGFEMDNGNIAFGGDDRELFERFDMVFSGHFHHRSRQGNIYYLGAFTEHTWSDWNDPRGFSIFDTETRQIEFYQNPFSIFKMISYDDVKNIDMLETIKTTDYSEYKDCYVKIVCVNRTNPYAFDMMIDKLYKAAPIDISVVEDYQVIKESNETEEVNQTDSTPKILDKYISTLTLPVETDMLKKYMIDIYTEAISMEHTE